MAKRGRKPTPTPLKILRGTRPDRVAKGEPRASGRPVCPATLDPIARKEWWRMLPILEAQGLLSAAAGPTLEVYCQAHSRWVAANAVIEAGGIERLDGSQARESNDVLRIAQGLVESTGMGGVKVSPWVHVAQAAAAEKLRALAEIGGTPSSRSRVHAGPGEGPQDDLAEFLAGKGRA